MKRTRIRAACAASLLALLLGGTQAIAQDADKAIGKSAPPPPGGDTTGTWAGQGAGPAGEYRGRLVCMREDQKFVVDGAADDCPASNRKYALKRSDGEAMHPLVTNDQTLLQRFDEMRGQEVQVEGKLYEATGMILVSAISKSAIDR